MESMSNLRCMTPSMDSHRKTGIVSFACFQMVRPFSSKTGHKRTVINNNRLVAISACVNQAPVKTMTPKDSNQKL